MLWVSCHRNQIQLGDNFSYPLLVKQYRKILMDGCCITWGHRPNVIRHPSIGRHTLSLLDLRVMWLSWLSWYPSTVYELTNKKLSMTNVSKPKHQWVFWDAGWCHFHLNIWQSIVHSKTPIPLITYLAHWLHSDWTVMV